MGLAGDGDEILVWRGPLRSLPRTLSVASARALFNAFGWLTAIASLAVLPDMVGVTGLHGWNRVGLTIAGFVTMAITAGLFLSARATPRRLELLVPSIAFVVFLTSCVLLNVAVVLVGPDFGGVTVFFVELLLMAFFVLRKSWAIAVTVLTLGLYAVALVALDHPPSPLLQFINVVAAAVATGVLIGAFANRLDDARRELADVNLNLEHRVAEQVGELERTGRLRRFLAPQVAEVVTSEGADELLAPHQRDIAVVFVDLRGFTAFTNAVGPEHIVFVLGDYYEVVGSVLEAHGATIGGFDGDGVMAYIGDPVPREDAATAATAMAREIAVKLDERVAKWSVDEQRLGFGIGLAYGTATLGVVGFEGRYDYTPVGAVVNLASRLCAEARGGEIVVDEAIRVAASLDCDFEPRTDVDLKGFGVVATYLVDH